MKLTEFNEAYNEYTLTEEYYLEEGLKFFKKSKRLKKYANKINKKVLRAESKKRVDPRKLSNLKVLSKNLTKLSDEYAVIEDDFAKGDANRKVSKERLKKVDASNKQILGKLKSAETIGVLKAIGLGAIVVGLGAALFQVGMTPQMTSVLTKGYHNAAAKALALKDATAASLSGISAKLPHFTKGIESTASGISASQAPGAASLAKAGASRTFTTTTGPISASRRKANLARTIRRANGN